MPMPPEDHRLSMIISPRAKRPEDNEGLRSLLVHRLITGYKAVMRRSLKNELQLSVFCEPCNSWSIHKSPITEIWECPKCSREYRVELIVFEELEPEER